MYHHSLATGVTPLTASEWRNAPRAFASYSGRFGVDPARLHFVISARLRGTGRRGGLRLAHAVPVGARRRDPRRGRDPRQRRGRLRPRRPGGGVARRVQPCHGRRLAPRSPLQCRSGRRRAPCGPPREASGGNTDHGRRAARGHGQPSAAGPARRRAPSAAVTDPALALRPGAARGLGAHGALRGGLLLDVGPGLPRLLDRALRPREHGPGRLEHHPGAPPGHHRRLRRAVLAPGGPRRPGAGALRAPVDGVVEPGDAAGRPGGDRGDGRPAGLLAGAALAGGRPAGDRRRGGLPAVSGPGQRHPVRLPPGHPGRAPAALSASGRSRRRTG